MLEKVEQTKTQTGSLTVLVFMGKYRLGVEWSTNMGCQTGCGIACVISTGREDRGRNGIYEGDFREYTEQGRNIRVTTKRSFVYIILSSKKKVLVSRFFPPPGSLGKGGEGHSVLREEQES